MQTVRKNPKALLLSFALVLALIYGCASAISKQTKKAADKDLKFEELAKDPQAHAGKLVILGGSIISVTNLPAGTEIIILERPLMSNQKPKSGDVSRGRFIVKSNKFLDAAIYKSNRFITVAGKVVGAETRPLGESTFNYPVIEEVELYLWTEESNKPKLNIGIGVGI